MNEGNCSSNISLKLLAQCQDLGPQEDVQAGQLLIQVRSLAPVRNELGIESVNDLHFVILIGIGGISRSNWIFDNHLDSFIIRAAVPEHVGKSV